MSKKTEEAVLFVVNIGKTSTKKNGSESESFLDKSKTVIRQVMERKIFLRPKDVTGVICIGSNETKNNLELEYITELEENLHVPTWDIIKTVLDLQGTQKSSNWVEGLYVALDYYKRESCKTLMTPIVIILNDFQEDNDVIEQFDASAIANEIKKAFAKLIIIGKTPNDDPHNTQLNLSEKLAIGVCEKAGGAYEDIENYICATRFYKNPPVKPNPWRCNLRIADVVIPIETYVKITEPPPFPSWKLISKENSVGFPPEGGHNIDKKRELVDRFREVTQSEDAIKGYKYGGKFIPFSDQDIEATKFRGTEKSLIVRGFVKQEDVSLEYWFGKGCHVIVPQADPNSKRKFYALLTAMARTGHVAIVRKVYQINNIPKMGVLFPRMQAGEPSCLVHIGIPFAEEKRVLKPKPVKTIAKNLTEDQKQDIEDYIDALTLAINDDEEDELFGPGSFCNPCKQYKWDSLSHRALSRLPLPPMDKSLVDLISPPESLIYKAQNVIERLAGWVKSTKEKEIEEAAESSERKQEETEQDLIKAAEDAENTIKKEEELFKEISQSTMNVDEDLLNEM